MQPGKGWRDQSMARPGKEEDATLSKEGRKEGKTNHLYRERGSKSAHTGEG